MAFRFEKTDTYQFQSGDLFLGIDEYGREIGMKTSRHAVVVAGARTGKGAAFIIPNILRWKGNILCIDPSGENVAATWRQLEAAGKKVVLLDPFREAEKLGAPARLRQSVNLLDAIDPNSPTVREDIRAIADGMVVRYKADDGTWDNGAVSVLAGFIAFVMATEPPERRNLQRVRFLLTMPETTREKVFGRMADIEGYGNLCRAAAAIGLSRTKKNQEFVGGAIDHSEWLDTDAIGETLKSSAFHLGELKTGNVAVFLVIPHDYIEDHKRFLRLFVRAALNTMSRHGKGGGRCLYLLDEFFSLGHIDQIKTGAAALPKYGVHLVPILQDLGQLQGLYTKVGAETFFGNSDAHVFFGNSDPLTLEYMSMRFGKNTPPDITSGPPESVGFNPAIHEKGDGLFMDDEPVRRARHEAKQQNALREHQHKMAILGSPRMPPDELAELVGKDEKRGDEVARSMVVFAPLGKILNLKLAPYFLPLPTPTPPPIAAPRPVLVQEKRFPVAGWGNLFMAFTSAAIAAAWTWLCLYVADHDGGEPINYAVWGGFWLMAGPLSIWATLRALWNEVGAS